MKKNLLTAFAVLLSLYGFSQTKGTSALSLGISSSTGEAKNNTLTGDQTTKSTNSNFRLGYGLFVAENSKVSIELLYNRYKLEYAGSPATDNTKGYGAAINYQRYFPLIKTFYAFAGGGAQYIRSKGDTDSEDSFDRINKTNSYSIGASGGLAWFISKRWAVETSVLSTGLLYSENEYSDISGNSSYTVKNTNFNLSSDGIFNNLGFKVYLMF
jgi:hypothetical protein